VKDHWPKVLLVLCFVAALVAIAPSRTKEPSADGHTLTEWLELARRTPVDGKVSNALCKIGAQAAPLLLAKMHTKATPLNDYLVTNGVFDLPWLFLHKTQEDQQYDAVFGFRFLRTNVISAVPELSKMFFDTNLSFVASQALGYLAPDATPLLISALGSTNRMFRYNAIQAIGETPEMVLEARTNLLPLIHDADYPIARRATYISIHGLPLPQATEAVAEAMADPRIAIQNDALDCVGDCIWTNRTTMLPAIKPFLHSADLETRRKATNLFNEISLPKEVHRTKRN
jgi:hypothetical protein